MSSIFHIIILGFFGGVAFGSLFDLGWSFWVLLLVLSAMCALARFFVDAEVRRFVLLSALLLLAFALGVGRVWMAQSPALFTLDSWINEKVMLEGVILAEPDVREKSTKLTLVPDTLVHENKQSELPDGTGRVLLTVDRYATFTYGDRVRVEGVLKAPENFENENGRVFDYVNFLEKDLITHQMFFPTVELESSGNGGRIKTFLLVSKGAFLQNVGEVLPEPHASLLGGLVVGAKQSLGQDLLDDFRRVGLIHIVVLSGYNVTLVAEFIIRIFSFLPRLLGMSLGAVGIVLFAILTGGGATVVRASAMALLVIVARVTGRTADMVRLLFIAGFLMVLVNPRILLYDPSFQLSMVATFGLLVLSPLVSARLTFVPEKFQLREIVSATLATQIAVLPLLLYMTGEMSLVALPVNMLALPVIPVTMFFGFLAGLAGFFGTAFSFIFASITYVFLQFELLVVEMFARLPFASVAVPEIPLGVVLIVYLIGLSMYIKTNRPLR